MKKINVFAVLAVLAVFTLTGVRCFRGAPREVREAVKPVTLKWWRTFDDEASMRPIIEAYRTLHPNVTIEYRKLRFEEYERELLNALAEDRGPDIVSLHNSRVREYLPKIAPLPASITLPYSEVKGGLRKEAVVTLRTSATITPAALRNTFVDVVADDVLVREASSGGDAREEIYGLPLAIDTLALFANRDLLNLAGVPSPPRTWSDFQNAVKKLTKFDERGRIVQSGAAIGTENNIERAADILALLMMQNGAEMISPQGQAVFDRVPPLLRDRQVPPGAEALAFYADFADPQKETYTYSAAEPNSLQAFVSGRTAMMFGYSYHLPLLRSRAARMNLAVARAPQIEGNPEVNFANYWIEAVSKKSRNPDWAWDFVLFAARAENVVAYLNATGKPTALRALINAQLEDDRVSVFASQALTAKGWYRGVGAPAAERALLESVAAVRAGAAAEEALKIAALKVNQTLR